MKLLSSPTVASWLRSVVLVAGLAVAGGVQAQFSMVPAPVPQAQVHESAAEVEKDYRMDAAKHLYASFPMRVYKGKMPALLYSVMIVDTEIDATGQVLNVNVVRKPAAAEVAPWVVALIKRVSPFPAPLKLGASVHYTDIWLVDKSGLFQLDTLTEGQK